MRIHTAAELREIDRHAADVLHVATALLMENAGRAVAEAALRELRGGRVVVVCGHGNNGGDGWVAARHLHARGLEVSVCSLAGLAELRGDALAAARAAQACGVPAATRLDLVGAGDVVVDAIFGTGLTRAVEGGALEAIRQIAAARARGARVVAVDLPSGLDADHPLAPGEHVVADVTVALHALKTAHVQWPAREACGVVTLEPIGIPQLFAPGPRRRLLDRALVAGLLPRRKGDAHKGTSGHVLVVAGSPGKSGAAMLACRAALRAGAGLVTLASAPEVIDRVLPAMPEVMGQPITSYLCDELARALDRKDALVVGPGLSPEPLLAAFIAEVARTRALPMLIDADGLNALALHRTQLGAFAQAAVAPVFTPHPAELARLLGTTTDEVQRDRFAAATKAAAMLRGHVVLKGAGSVIAHPDGTLEVNPTGNPAMATAGTGDVLAGVGGALLANRISPAEALVIATWVHGRAGDLAAKGRTRGLIASDVIEALPDALAELA